MKSASRRPDLDEAREEITTLYDELSVEEIATKFDAAPHTIYRRLRAWGVPMRVQGRQKSYPGERTVKPPVKTYKRKPGPSKIETMPIGPRVF